MKEAKDLEQGAMEVNGRVAAALQMSTTLSRAVKKHIEELTTKSLVIIEERGNVKGERQAAIEDPCVMEKGKNQTTGPSWKGNGAGGGFWLSKFHILNDRSKSMGPMATDRTLQVRICIVFSWDRSTMPLLSVKLIKHHQHFYHEGSLSKFLLIVSRQVVTSAFTSPLAASDLL